MTKEGPKEAGQKGKVKPKSGRPQTLPAESCHQHRFPRWHLGLILGVALICYVQAASYGFVYDDQVQVVENPRLRSFSNLGNAFTENFWAFRSAGSNTNYYRPLQTLSYMTAYALGGLSPRAFHWINILAHILASLAVYWLGVEFLGAYSTALWGALLFAAHPMHTEAVTWVAGLPDVACGLFYFVSLSAYLRYRKEIADRVVWQWIAALAFFLALLYKEMALTLPLVVVLSDFLDENRARSRAGWIRRLIPFLLTLAVYLALRVNALGTFARTTLALSIGPADRALTTFYLTGRYVQDLLLPIRQNAYHVFVPFSRLSPLNWALPALLLAGLAYFIWFWLRRDKRLSFLALFTVVSILPVLNLSGVGQNPYTERYLYIPSAGFCLLFAALICHRLGGSNVSRIVQGAIVVLLGVLTVARNPVWRDDKTLYETTLRDSPDAAAFRNNLGRILVGEHDIPRARQAFEAALDSESRAVAGSPMERAISLLGLSTVAGAEGRAEDAWKYAAAARDQVPDLGEAYQAMGVARLRQGNAAEAENLLRRAVELTPGSAAAHTNLGSALFLKNEVQSAESEFRKAIQLDPGLPGPRIALAQVLAQSGRASEALSSLEEALRLDPSNPQARQLLQQIPPK